jgi:hypothetical protein
MASTSGLLTPENCVVAFCDVQAPLLAAVASASQQAVLHANLMLAKAAHLFGVPQLRSIVGTADAPADFETLFHGHGALVRSSMSAWDDRRFTDAVDGTGRGNLVLAGLATASYVTLAALQAIDAGYTVYVVEDCCGDSSTMAHDNAMQRMVQAGVRPVTAMAVMLEWQRDWSRLETGDAVRAIARAHCSAGHPLIDCPPGSGPGPQPVFPGFIARGWR